MGFREREEYRDWRAQVLGLFGSQCVICQHSGNLHIHHIKPVQTYPELAFEPSNGVPLCGNCHAQVTGREEEFEDELHPDRTAGGDCDHRDPGGVAAAGAGLGEGTGQAHCLHEQFETVGVGQPHLRGRKQRHGRSGRH